MHLFSTIRQSIVRPTKRLLKNATGKKFLDKEQTVTFLKDYLVASPTESNVALAEVRDVADDKIIFDQVVNYGNRNFVWAYESQSKNDTLLPIGSLSANDTVLRTDFGYPNLFTNDFGGRAVFRDFLLPRKRISLEAETVIAPWSQYFRGEYYMFIMFIAAKLSRIKQVIPAEVYNNAIVAYPFFNTSFEPEYLKLLGFREEQLFDTRQHRVSFEKCILGNSDHWYYPNKEDIYSLRKLVESQMPITKEKTNDRIYISRAGRRRVLNEDELIRMLLKYDFKILEDKPRSVTEQFQVYNNASFIMGPHGASFSNIIWARPNTHLFELFPQTYLYNFFQYLSEITQVGYSAYCHGTIHQHYTYTATNDDMTVSVSAIEKYLEKVLR
jgi:capsular polysaccharide biosynthesis protein